MMGCVSSIDDCWALLPEGTVHSEPLDGELACEFYFCMRRALDPENINTYNEAESYCLDQGGWLETPWGWYEPLESYTCDGADCYYPSDHGLTVDVLVDNACGAPPGLRPGGAPLDSWYELCLNMND